MELFDGFKSHKNVLKAHEIRAKNKINSLKEESNSSHANQGYDPLTAMMDKKTTAKSLYNQRKVKKYQTSKKQLISTILF